MPQTPIRPQLVADLVEAARQATPIAGPVVVHAAPGATVNIYTQLPVEASKSPTPDA